MIYEVEHLIFIFTECFAYLPQKVSEILPKGCKRNFLFDDIFVSPFKGS